MEFVQRGITDSNGLNHESSKRESNQYKLIYAQHMKNQGSLFCEL